MGKSLTKGKTYGRWGVWLYMEQNNLISISANKNIIQILNIIVILCLQVNLSSYENVTVFLAPSVVNFLMIVTDADTHMDTHYYKHQYLHKYFTESITFL